MHRELFIGSHVQCSPSLVSTIYTPPLVSRCVPHTPPRATVTLATTTVPQLLATLFFFHSTLLITPTCTLVHTHTCFARRANIIFMFLKARDIFA